MQIVAVTDPLTRVPPAGDDRHPGRRATSTRSPTPWPRIDEVDYVVITAGSFDILAEVVCEDDEHLLETDQPADPHDPGVRSTETFVYLELRKQTYTWGTR